MAQTNRGRGAPARGSGKGRGNRGPPARRQSRMVPGVLGVVVAALVVLLVFRSSSGGEFTAASGVSAGVTASTPQAGAAFKGNPNATVVLEAYEDYLCPFCLRFFQNTEGPLMAAYGDRIKFVFHDFPQEGPHPFSTKAGEAARCAGDQGKYWEMHDALYSRQREWGYKGNSPDFFRQYASELGLDTAAFNSCFDGNVHRRDVLLDLDGAQKKGVGGTPSFIVNGQRIVGAQPFNVFAAAIESALGVEAARTGR